MLKRRLRLASNPTRPNLLGISDDDPVLHKDAEDQTEEPGRGALGV